MTFGQDQELTIYINLSSPNASNDHSCWKGGETLPCKTFDLGLQGIQEWLTSESSRLGVLMIAAGNYKLRASNHTCFKDIRGLKMFGYAQESISSTPQPVTINCYTGVGFTFLRSSNIYFSGITFFGCGKLQTSTSFNLDLHNPAYVPFNVGLYFLYCQNLTFHSIKVDSTPGTGMVIYNTVGENRIEKSIFSNNVFQPESNISGGGGLYVEFSFCDPQNISCLENDISNVDKYYIQHSKFTIENTNFINNYGNISSSAASGGTFILPIGRYHSAFGRGGGLLFFIIGKAYDIHIVIRECLIANNTALWGAGLLAEFHDNSNSNYLEVKESRFINNSLYFDDVLNKGTGGGGARVAMFMFYENSSIIYNNNIIFESCSFEGNDAYYGGGFSFYTTKNNGSFPPNHVQLVGCNFTGNTARLGAGIDMSIFHPSIEGINPKVFIHNCNLSGNNALYRYHPGALIGVGAMYIDSLPVQFDGNMSFENNLGSALAVTGSYIEILSTSTIVFRNNTGRNGGGITLLGTSFIVTHPNSSLLFISNSADFFGGAIFYYSSGERDLFASGNCFIRYSNIFISNVEWTSSFYFEANTANGNPNAIYTSSVLPCILGGVQWNTSSTYNKTREVFCWNQNWIYKTSTEKHVPCYTQISTAPSNYTINSTFSSIPGKDLTLNEQVQDDLGNSVTGRTVFIVRIMNGTGSFKSDEDLNFNYVSDGFVNLKGQPGSEIDLQIETTDPVIIQNKFRVNFQNCPPGFHSNFENSSASCVCSGNYSGYIQCNQENFTARILRAVWIGNVSGFDTLLVGETPYISGISSDHFIHLESNPDTLQDFFCGEVDRQGVFCSECREGYGVPVDRITSKCVPCSHNDVYYHWIFYLLTDFLPIVVFFAVVFIFSMTVTFGPLNSYIFFAQVITTVMKIDADGMIPLDSVTTIPASTLQSFYVVPYDVWNLNFFQPWLPKYCLSPSLKAIDVMTLGYVQAVFPLFLLFLFVGIINLYHRGVPFIVCLFRPFHRLFARFRQWTNLRQSITGGMAVFVVVSYTKFSLVSLQILTPTSLYNPDGTVAARVFYMDGDIPFGIKSIRYIIPAVLVSATFVLIPPVLFAYTTLLQVCSRLSCRRLRIDKFYPTPKLQAFLDEFHGCYKDGSDGGLDCRWFASLYFCLRIALFAVYSGTGTWQLQYTTQILFFLFAAFLFAVFRPYRKDWINNIDMSMFLLLAAISTLSFYNLMLTWIGKPLSKGAFAVQYIFIFLPLIYCIGYYSFLFCDKTKMCWAGMMKRKNQSSQSLFVTPDSESVESHSALEDSTHVPNFLDFTENTGRLTSRIQLTNPQIWNPRKNTSINNYSDESAPLLTPSGTGTSTSSEKGSKGFTRSTKTDEVCTANTTTSYGATGSDDSNSTQ